MSEIDVLMVQIPPEMIHNWGWFLALGIGLVVLGTTERKVEAINGAAGRLPCQRSESLLATRENGR